jgi:hypothetical protein
MIEQIEYVYSRHKSADRASWALDDYIAQDIVCEAERPTYRHAPRYKGDPLPWVVIFLD